MANEMKITTAHAHCKKLEKYFTDWLHNDLNNREFASKATVEIQGLTKVLNYLISRSMD